MSPERRAEDEEEKDNKEKRKKKKQKEKKRGKRNKEGADPPKKKAWEELETSEKELEALRASFAISAPHIA